MRLFPRFAPLLAALILPLTPAYGDTPHLANLVKTGPHARVPVDRPFGAECRIRIEGSYVITYCHNPYPEVDRLALHIECDRWWDLDSDGTPVAVGPTQTVRLTGRCWKEVRSAWVTHKK
ncbi:hypothetical protein [Streptomyces ureilyticus]|uniref:Uncharacterized protein n=1 Tax=Streptomyces ureilyticus TaxID=1775131 RepID=A0ABX0E2J5_9ACTN|nr:hypothetical protein [Streptomyces ureilyticus]NGO47105.1 hypothetical protein [Streptomyces ureilyticus]